MIEGGECRASAPHLAHGSDPRTAKPAVQSVPLSTFFECSGLTLVGSLASKTSSPKRGLLIAGSLDTLGSDQVEAERPPQSLWRASLFSAHGGKTGDGHEKGRPDQLSGRPSSFLAWQ